MAIPEAWARPIQSVKTRRAVEAENAGTPEISGNSGVFWAISGAGLYNDRQTLALTVFHYAHIQAAALSHKLFGAAASGY
jgi:hypothetical protein